MNKAPPRKPAGKRARSEAYGRNAERVAVAYLRMKGYRILARRFRCPAGEIDIVTKRGGTIIFIEVKARKNTELALEAVTPNQKKRILNAARAWLAQRQLDQNTQCRFDMIALSAYLIPKHIVNAFGADPCTW